jgi:glycosyltransferase involved in cell wall biosynthesis
VRILDNRHRFDWIEIQSEEGIGIGIQKRFPRRTILRIHTTLAQMIDHREIELTRASALRLRREKESFRSAERVVTHSERHASELRRLPDLRGPVHVVRHGIGDLRFEREADPAHDPVVDDGAPTFLVVGTPDRRKGFDRIAPVLAAYAGKHGPCKCVVVSTQDSSAGKPFGLGRGMPPGVELRWLNTLSGKDYVALYGEASALLALARYESFGFPLIEAACLSVPVVTTDVGIASELLTNSLSRFIVDGDSPEICADALHRAVRRKDTVGRDLRLKYETQFTREKMAGDYEAYLRLPEG